MELVSLLIWLLVLLLVLVVLKYVIAELPLPANVQHVVLLIIGVVGLLLILQRLGLLSVRI